MPVKTLAAPIKPRSVADKSTKKALLDAIRLTLAEQSDAVRTNTGTFNANRYKATALIHDYDVLKDRARAVKEQAIERLPDLVDQVKQAVELRGGKVFLAKDAAEASTYVKEVLLAHGARSVVKSKSITSEEIHLNAALEPEGIEVVETDLAEFILQLADEQPSHIVAPAIHYSRERISKLFLRHFPETTEVLDSGEALTDFARKILRQKFLQADAGITGANFITADTGSLVLVESEANIRMAMMAPPLHIAVAGMEKIIPKFDDIPTFIELLGASGTGQPLTSYTSVVTPPLPLQALDFRGTGGLTRSRGGGKEGEEGLTRSRGEAEGGGSGREFHLVLIDNGRLAMRDDPDLREALYCIRCSACMNVCGNFQTVGGHAFGGESYSGGIGGAWEAGTGSLEKARFSELCTGCSRCVPNCPVRIDIPWLNIALRHRLNQRDADRRFADVVFEGLLPSVGADRKAPFQKQFFGHYAYTADKASRMAKLSNAIGRTKLFRKALAASAGVDLRRPLPPFAGQTLVEAGRKLLDTLPPLPADAPEAVLFADSFTNYGHPGNGLALIRILHRLGVRTHLTGCVPDGRAALSQGMIPTATEQAKQTAQLLEPHVDAGRPILVIEPSVLALFKSDYRHLLPFATFEKMKALTWEPVAFVGNVLQAQNRRPGDIFARAGADRVFFHGHCQQRSQDLAQPTVDLLRDIGIEVGTSTAECCGMAGSFGYKEGFYEISEQLGRRLAEQVEAVRQRQEVSRQGLAEGTANLVVLASGTSCVEQLSEYARCEPVHPLVFLESIMRP